MSVQDLFTKTKEMIEMMEEERKKCAEFVVKEPENEVIRRIVIRSIFSIFEGMCFRFKVTALLVGKKRGIEFSAEDRAMIEEETYYLDDKGEAKTKQYYPTFKSNIQFAFNILARVYGSGFKLDLGGQEWEIFREAIEIRHKITHPKDPLHLKVPKEEFDKVIRSYDWFLSNMRKLGKEIR